jgi:putative MATE family efflux protein
MDYRVLYEKTPVGRLFALVAIPGIISMLVSSFYQLFDGIFVGQILGADAFAAVNLVMPFVIINFSVADLIGVGSAVPIAIRLGEKKEKDASNIFSSACLLILGAGILLGAVLFFFTGDILRLMGADAGLIGQASQYIRVYALCSPVTTIVFAMDNYLRICGRIRYSMFLNILMSALSAGLEFLFLYVFRFGIWGAALGTCLGMMTCALLALAPFVRGRLQLKFGRPRLNSAVLKSIFFNGCPTFLSNLAGRITSIVMNIFLLRMGGAMAVSAYGVLMYVDGFIQPLLYGMCDSLQPAVGYNWGAKRKDRVKAIEKRCFSLAAAVSLVMTLIVFLAREEITGLFVQASDQALFRTAVHALELFAFAYLIRWFSFAAQSFLSAVEKPGYATLLSVSVALVFPLILLFALEDMGLDGIWLNFPLTSLLCGGMAAVILIRFLKKIRTEQSA